MPSTYYERVVEILDDAANINAAVNEVMGESDALNAFVIKIGLEKILSTRRRARRQELRAMLQPEFKYRRSGNVVFTDEGKKRMLQYAKTLYAKDGWNIGDLNIADITKKQLLAMAQTERNSANGHLANAQLYEAIAEPMEDDDQIVRDFWDEKEFERKFGKGKKSGKDKDDDRPTA